MIRTLAQRVEIAPEVIKIHFNVGASNHVRAVVITIENLLTFAGKILIALIEIRN
jgi:hypothetical protein